MNVLEQFKNRREFEKLNGINLDAELKNENEPENDILTFDIYINENKYTDL